MPRKNSNADRTNDKNERDNNPTYTSESRPELPTANVTTEYPTPVIDQRLIDIRNREAQQMADRIAASKRGG